METFFLVDGAMVYSEISTSKVFAEVNAPWFAPLMPSTELWLAGPVLISQDQARAANSEPVATECVRIVNSYPHRLHFAVIESALPLDQLAAHLRHFVYFADDTGQPYGLRIADGRVMAYLPGVLTRDQWDALTAPVATWAIHDRIGTHNALVLNESRAERNGALEPLVLSETQIERLIDAGEPDTLLAQLGVTPDVDASKKLKWHHEVARYCVSRWKQSGSSDRRVLLTFARRVFASQCEWIRDAGRVEQELRAAAAQAV
ncbi:DUF4123 domain-containing protein [Variovorax sp. ZS18.2.2]|uniref:DUF4123 domain-containing protein n=1 Tax=Variovorax sp. ZS18.2.2 TaxID=2971255 RepID=UPI002151D772|nr:DUF4123 domain-containing protein [Variovorax sp. ZS18.2.2]MCR6480028.1 DUF4123 domain-containing protein [Variovorax sp. ZS18.2.2]